MLISGEEAKRYNAVRLGSFACVNEGELVTADELDGVVEWKNKMGEAKRVSLGMHAIRIVLRR